jgi:hypothetical protein
VRALGTTWIAEVSCSCRKTRSTPSRTLAIHPVVCSLERVGRVLKNSSSGARRNSPPREGPDPKRIEAFALKTASTSWSPCRLVLAGQLVCSAKLSDQILWKDFEPIKANRPVIMATVGSCSADSRRFRRPDFRVREAAGRSSATGCFSKRRIDGA